MEDEFFLWFLAKGTCWSLRVDGGYSKRQVEMTDCFVGRWNYIYIYIYIYLFKVDDTLIF